MLGGAFAALGVLGMHYLGMLAQRMNATMELNAGIVVLSVLIAFFTANAAFWILFRAVREVDVVVGRDAVSTSLTDLAYS